MQPRLRQRQVARVAEGERQQEEEATGGGGGGGERVRPWPTCSPRARTPAVKVRETDSIKLLPLPMTPQFNAWKIALRSEVVAASGRPKSALNWIIETENPRTTFEEMADCGEFESLDCKLEAALGKIAKGSIGRAPTNAAKSMAKRSLMTSGRQLLHLTYEQYALDPTRGSLYYLNHLMDIKSHGYANIEQFLLTWNETVEGLSKPQPHDVLEAILWKQIEPSAKMAQPFSRYLMAKQGSSKRSYKYLHGTLARDVKEDRNEKTNPSSSRRRTASRPPEQWPAWTLNGRPR